MAEQIILVQPRGAHFRALVMGYPQAGEAIGFTWRHTLDQGIELAEAEGARWRAAHRPFRTPTPMSELQAAGYAGTLVPVQVED